jgi:hypothetical protein
MKMPRPTILPQMGAKRHWVRDVWDSCNQIQATVLWSLGLVAGGGFEPPTFGL